MNIHAPERQEGESHDDYRARRRHSRDVIALAKIASLQGTGRFVQRVNSTGKHRRAARDQGQHPKFDAPRKHKPKQPITATWPDSDDQKAQSRPLIVLGKNRERDAGKRTKPKSAVAKRMDRPHRAALMEAGHAKLMRFFTL